MWECADTRSYFRLFTSAKTCRGFLMINFRCCNINFKNKYIIEEIIFKIDILREGKMPKLNITRKQ